MPDLVTGLLDSVWQARDLSTAQWVLIAVGNIVALVAWVTFAARLRLWARSVRLGEEALSHRFAEYYGAMGGPAVIPRKATVWHALLAWGYLGANCRIIFVDWILPAVCGAVTLATLAMWQGRPIFHAVGRLFRRHPRGLTEVEDFVASQADSTAYTSQPSN